MNLSIFVWTLSDAIGILILSAIALLYIAFKLCEFFTK